MFLFVMRSLRGRVRTYALVLVELIVGFVCLTLTVTGWEQTREMARRASYGGSLETQQVALWACNQDAITSALTELRRAPGVARASAIYYLGGDATNGLVGVDAESAAMIPKQVTTGRWFVSQDFLPNNETVPVILGHDVLPSLSPGSRVPHPASDKFVMIGRLKAGQYAWLANGTGLPALVRSDSLMILPHTVEMSISNGTLLLIEPKPGKAAAVVSALGSVLENRVHSAYSSVPIGQKCTSSSITTLAQELKNYNEGSRPFIIAILAISLIVLGIGLLGFIGIAMVVVEQRTREFAIRLAVGATKRVIAWQLVVEISLLSLLSSALGIPLGVLLGTQLNQALGWNDIAMIIGAGMLVGILSALGPVTILLRRPPSFFIRNGR